MRMLCSYAMKPKSNLRCSPIGLVRKKPGGFRLIIHMYHPSSDSDFNYFDTESTSVKNSDFDNAIKMRRN